MASRVAQEIGRQHLDGRAGPRRTAFDAAPEVIGAASGKSFARHRVMTTWRSPRRVAAFGDAGGSSSSSSSGLPRAPSRSRTAECRHCPGS